MVGRLTVAQGRDHAHRDSEKDGENGGQDHHSHGDQHVSSELRTDRLAGDSDAEVTVNRVREPDPIPLPQRIIEVEYLLARDVGRKGRVRVQLKQRQWVARLCDEEKDEDGRQQEHDHADEQAA